MLATLVVLASLAVWEGLKACWRNCVAPRFLGSQSRQALRLRRLQEAVEQELHAQLGSSSSTSEHHTPERRPRPSDVPSMPAWGEDRSRVRRPRQVALGSPRVQSNPASSAPDRLMTPVRSITNPRSPDPRFMSAPARSTRLQTSPALSTGAREIGVQTDYETPQVVERFIPTYPNSVFVTSGRSYHLNASCQAEAKASLEPEDLAPEACCHIDKFRLEASQSKERQGCSHSQDSPKCKEEKPSNQGRQRCRLK